MVHVTPGEYVGHSLTRHSASHGHKTVYVVTLSYRSFVVSLLSLLPIRDQVSTLLNKTAIDLVEAGRMEIFTPSYFFAARKK